MCIKQKSPFKAIFTTKKFPREFIRGVCGDDEFVVLIS